ncbi:MAG: sigma-54 dependent transcriptional regulator [Caldimicrobium sp.]
MTNIHKNFFILIVEDEEISLKYLARLLEKEGFYVEGASTGEEALDKVKKGSYDLVLLDLRLPDINGLELLPEIKKLDEEINVIIITAYGSIESAVSAIKAGASDYLTKPIEVEELLLKINNIYEKKRLQRENIALKTFQEISERPPFIAKSKVMQEILNVVEDIKNTDTTILITGETGTGKTALAKYLHFTSNRKDKPFISINCSLYTEELLASELFGYEKGAFTGAFKSKPGHIELAHGGTLFLDEITEIPVSLQAKFLKILEDKEIFRLGGTKPIKVDVRFIAATNKNIHSEIEKRNFRRDLYYRLSVIEINIPPLRERKEDIPPLSEFFIQKYNKKFKKKVKGFTKEAWEVLMEYNFPGNVRELENIIERSVLLCKGEYITPDLFPQTLQLSSVLILNTKEIKPLEDITREYARKVLEIFGGNKTKAAEALGISRTSLWRLLKENLK